ncbi:DinB family protein [Winogradskyella bathintestinalis]|uniref:DUF664 domain-containing protein n=1 Tax=Winogradskyella bathintestinalis TaxID=3035208 RepID=A0ABT7ZY63_9FLAO|nr:DUF664 domain-containing protein [Winogradskyella bathintestinalis]MDN3493953.1 DUF664 domain-containing protein [Winogradskyella bathintestinalis]
MKIKIQILFVITSLFTSALFAQYEIKPPEGYSQNIGNMVAMLDNLKERVVHLVDGLDQDGTDFLLDENANRIGAIIYHLAATEAYYQSYTFEGRAFNKDEKKRWATALSLGEKAREEFIGQPISFYLKIFDEVRQNTKQLLKTKDDAWFAEVNGGMSNHWAWFHVMEHQANHMGQLALITKRVK